MISTSTYIWSHTTIDSTEATDVGCNTFYNTRFAFTTEDIFWDDGEIVYFFIKPKIKYNLIKKILPKKQSMLNLKSNKRISKFRKIQIRKELNGRYFDSKREIYTR